LQTYTHEELRADFGWEPTRSGLRCGVCSRRRRRAASKRASYLIDRTVPKWSLVVIAPAHDTYDECFECEALAIAAATLLRRGALTRSEASAMTAAVVARPGRRTTRCAQELAESVVTT
jgi:hypothetical protein